MSRKAVVLLFSVAMASLSAGCSGEVAPTPGLNIGNRAPELEGTDVNGRAISLAEFQGKVIVVDFWATWCGPCRQMTPESKKLVQRMAGRPFAFLGVSADSSRADLKQYLDANEINWPNIYDGRPGPIGASWKIEYFPTVFVIDHKGVIRYRDLHGRDLDRAVERLVAEAEGARS